jgi:hypothetical protein
MQVYTHTHTQHPSYLRNTSQTATELTQLRVKNWFAIRMKGINLCSGVDVVQNGWELYYLVYVVRRIGVQTRGFEVDNDQILNAQRVRNQFQFHREVLFVVRQNNFFPGVYL